MADLNDVIAYLLIHYPSGHQLSLTRLMRIVYLADWRSAIAYRHQLTNVQWSIKAYGPYSAAVRMACDADPFQVLETVNERGRRKLVIRLADQTLVPTLDEAERTVLARALDDSSVSWEDLTRLV